MSLKSVLVPTLLLLLLGGCGHAGVSPQAPLLAAGARIAAQSQAQPPVIHCRPWMGPVCEVSPVPSAQP